MMIKRLLIAIFLLFPCIATAQEQESANSKKLRYKVHPVGDLAVWTRSGEFDPSVLIRLIKLKTGDLEGISKQNNTEVIVNAPRPDLLVKASEEDQKAIADLLAEVRKPPEVDKNPNNNFALGPELRGGIQLVSHLPVFNKEGKFESSLIFSLLQCLVEKDTVQFKPLPKEAPELFLIIASKKDHEIISNLIGSIRAGTQPQTNPTNE